MAGERGGAVEVEDAASNQLLRRLAALQGRCIECLYHWGISTTIVRFAIRLLVALLGS